VFSFIGPLISLNAEALIVPSEEIGITYFRPVLESRISSAPARPSSLEALQELLVKTVLFVALVRIETVLEKCATRSFARKLFMCFFSKSSLIVLGLRVVFSNAIAFPALRLVNCESIVSRVSKRINGDLSEWETNDNSFFSRLKRVDSKSILRLQLLRSTDQSGLFNEAFRVVTVKKRPLFDLTFPQ